MMPKWEYEVLRAIEGESAESRNAKLNERGKAGWELVSHVFEEINRRHEYTLKRKVAKTGEADATI